MWASGCCTDELGTTMIDYKGIDDRDAGEGMADAVVASIYASLPGKGKE